MTLRIPLIAKPEWTTQEEEKLRLMVNQGDSPLAIGKELNRSEGAIGHRMSKLGLRPKRVKAKAK
jgi:DNA-binding NarL/FixJ family response regulator